MHPSVCFCRRHRLVVRCYCRVPYFLDPHQRLSLAEGLPSPRLLRPATAVLAVYPAAANANVKRTQSESKANGKRTPSLWRNTARTTQSESKANAKCQCKRARPLKISIRMTRKKFNLCRCVPFEPQCALRTRQLRIEFRLSIPSLSDGQATLSRDLRFRPVEEERK